MRIGLGCLAAAGLAVATPADAAWRKFETTHFIIYSQSDDKRATELARGLENIDGLMRMATGLPMASEPVKVRIYEMADEGQVQAALGEQGTGIAGFYRSNVLGPFAVTLRKAYSADGDFTAEIVLHHEYAHHFMLQYFPAIYPPWYVEGFAELIGATKTLDDGKVAYGYPAKYRGGYIAAAWVPMQDVLLKPPEKLYMDWYGQGWAMTHFLTFSKERAPQLRRYLAMLTAGKTAAEAATAFGDLGDLNREAHLYLLRGVFNYHPVQVPISEPVVKSVTAIGSAEAALIPETIAFNDENLDAYRKAGDRERERKRRSDVLNRVRSKASQYANDPYALYFLAHAERSAGNSAAAEQAVDRLMLVQPSNVDGMSLKSLLLADGAMAVTGPARAAKAAEARRLAVAANKADPDNALTYVAFYESFRAMGATPPAGAIDGLVAAVEKLPEDTHIRQLLVDEYVSEGQIAAAIATLIPIANDPHESPLRQAAREQVATLQAKLAEQRSGKKSGS
jgi:tetratricopeptide (TPR) repeat protein